MVHEIIRLEAELVSKIVEKEDVRDILVSLNEQNEVNYKLFERIMLFIDSMYKNTDIQYLDMVSRELEYGVSVLEGYNEIASADIDSENIVKYTIFKNTIGQNTEIPISERLEILNDINIKSSEDTKNIEIDYCNTKLMLLLSTPDINIADIVETNARLKELLK